MPTDAELEEVAESLEARDFGRRDADDAIDAAYPVIERQVRAKVSAELKVLASDWGEHRGYRDVMDFADAIEKGKT